MAARALLAGAGAARALRAGGDGRLEVALGAGGYVRLGADGWLLLTGPRAPLGPLSLLVARLGETAAPAAAAEVRDARVEDGALMVGARRIDLAGLRVAGAPAWPRPAPGGDGAAALAAAAAAGPPPPTALEPGLAALRRGTLPLAVSLLAGRGAGLTPAGDDVLAGYAGWAAATTGRPVDLATPATARCSPIGLAYLRCAQRGELPAPAAAVIAAALEGDHEAVARRARVLRRWGSTSGAAMLWGILAAARTGGQPRPSSDRGRPDARPASVAPHCLG